MIKYFTLLWLLLFEGLNVIAFAGTSNLDPVAKSFADALQLTEIGLEKINGPHNQCDENKLSLRTESPRTNQAGRMGKIRAANGQDIEISILPLDQIKRLFDEMASQPHIPFGYPDGGCYARAHEMSILMEQKGIISGKMFIEGELRVETPKSPQGYVEWVFHVAPFVLVEKDGKLEPYVIDPSIFSEPVPLEDWFAIQTRHEDGQRQATHITNRFHYTNANAEVEQRDSYNPADLISIKETFLKYMPIQRERERQRWLVSPESSNRNPLPEHSRSSHE